MPLPSHRPSVVLLMADSFIPHASRRERDRLRRVLRRRKAKLTAIAAVSVVVVALVALVSTDTLRLGGGGGRLGADASAAAPLVDDPRRPAEAAALSELDPPRRIDHDSPLRLWVGGDSLAGWLGPSLGALARETGVVATQIDYKVSSGIASDGVRNWPERAASEIEEHDPEAIVFMIGTNDASIVNHRTNEDGVYEWEPEYRSEVAEMMDLFVGGDAHRTVFWVGAPTTRTEWRDDGVVELNRVMQEEAESRDDVVFVDAYSLFAGEDGQYVDSLIGEDGEYVRVRNGDGVHFTTAGGDRLAAAVFALLDARWEILDQADPDNPIEPDYSAGSGGYVSGGANVTYGGVNDSTVPEDPTTSAPPTTGPSTPSTTEAASTTTASPSTSSPSSTTRPPSTTAPPVTTTAATTATTSGSATTAATPTTSPTATTSGAGP